MSRTSDYSMSERERQNLRLLANYDSVQTIPEIWAIAAQRFGSTTVLHDPHSKPAVKLSYAELHQQIQHFATGLQVLGIQPNEHLALFSDNSPRWFIADQGIMMAGAANAVRSSQAEREELLFILEHSDSVALVVEQRSTLELLDHRLHSLPIRFAILLSDEAPPEDAELKVLNFSQVMDLGRHATLRPVQSTPDTLATLIYTSGTTGKPKGVMLTHGNLLHQVQTFGSVVQPKPGDRVLSILPTWHSYERSVEYFLLSQGCTLIYTSIRTIKKDLKQVNPHYMVSVPRIWESIYESVQKQFQGQSERQQHLIRFFLSKSQQYIDALKLWQNLDLLHQDPGGFQRAIAGLRAAILYPLHALGEGMVYKKVRQAVTGNEFRQAISGGGSLAKHLDDFFEIVGVNVLVGYGLTETAPVTNVRRPWRNLRGSSGQPLPGTEIQIVDLETRQPLPPGQHGLVLIRGPQVMQGYYKNLDATVKAISLDRWFDSGDLGWVTRQNDLVLTGRAKDTIVLTNGENIEPQPIEDACLRSPYIDQIMLVGQDQKSLGALIVPNLEALQSWAAEAGFTIDVPNPVSPQPSDRSPQPVPIALNAKPIHDLFRRELNREVQDRPGYRIDDRISLVRLILEPFAIENGLLTQTLKIRRNVVMERYRGMINEMFE
jgi:long-chain acyl-CoA synthetase